MLSKARSTFGRILDLLTALRLRRGPLERVERGSRGDLLELQERRVNAILEHAWTHSPFYRRRWGEVCPKARDLASLEPVTKAELVRNYDDVLADRTLTRAKLQEMLGKPGRASHIVIATSGTTGEPFVVPYSRSEWIEALAYCMRGERRRSGSLHEAIRVSRRMAAVMTDNPIHASTNLNDSFRVPPLRQLRIAASLPVKQQAAALEEFQPTCLSGYPSAIDALARAQLEGRLSIHPKRVLVGGESLPEGLRERARQAWGAEIFDSFGLTETLVFAHECLKHAGLHVDEDAVLMEVVDSDRRVLPIGKIGSGVLLTNLYNRTLPIIRYQVGDVLRLDDSACACGCPFARIVAIEGRRDEILKLRGRARDIVEVHPTAFESPLEASASVRKFQICQSDGALQVIVELGVNSLNKLRDLECAVARVAEEHSVDPAAVEVVRVDHIEEERGLTDKRRRIVRG